MVQPPHASRQEASAREEAEASMESPLGQAIAQPSADPIINASCAHGRLIDDVLTKSGKRTGKVRCLECRSIFEDPYHGLK